MKTTQQPDWEKEFDKLLADYAMTQHQKGHWYFTSDGYELLKAFITQTLAYERERFAESLVKFAASKPDTDAMNFVNEFLNAAELLRKKE